MNMLARIASSTSLGGPLSGRLEAGSRQEKFEAARPIRSDPKLRYRFKWQIFLAALMRMKTSNQSTSLNKKTSKELAHPSVVLTGLVRPILQRLKVSG